MAAEPKPLLVRTDDPAVSDESLAGCAAQGDRAAFATLVRRHQAAVHGYLVQMVRDVDAAHDLAQETFINVWRHMDSFDCQKKFRTWLFTIATNLGRNHFRGTRRFQRACESLKVRLEWLGERPTPRDATFANMEEAQVRAAVQDLPEIYRMVVWLRYFDDLSSQEVAEILTLTPATVDTRLLRARQMLRRKLADLAPHPAVTQEVLP